MDNNQKTSMGLNENIASLLCYALFWVTGLVFFLVEKENKNVKFHAFQSLVTFGALNLTTIALNFLRPIPFIGKIAALVSTLIGLLTFVLWIVLMVKAYQGQKFKLPVVGDLAEQQANK